jgi:hypothetical protein
MSKKKERNIGSMFDDPVCPADDDVEFMEEMFDIYRDQGMTVEQVGEDDPEEGKRYAEWLKRPENLKSE